MDDLGKGRGRGHRSSYIGTGTDSKGTRKSIAIDISGAIREMEMGSKTGFRGTYDEPSIIIHLDIGP